MPFALPPLNLNVNLTARDVNCCNGGFCCVGVKNGGNVQINTPSSRPASSRPSDDDDEGSDLQKQVPGNTPLIFDVEDANFRPITQKEQKNSRKSKEMCETALEMCYNSMQKLNPVVREVLLGACGLDFVKKYKASEPLTVREYKSLATKTEEVTPISKIVIKVVELASKLAPPPTLDSSKRPKKTEVVEEELSQRLEVLVMDPKNRKRKSLDNEAEKVPAENKPVKPSVVQEPSAESAVEAQEQAIDRLFLKVVEGYPGLTLNDLKFIRINTRVWKTITSLTQASSHIKYVACANRHAESLVSLAQDISVTWKEIKGRRREMNLAEVLERIIQTADESEEIDIQ